MLIVLEISKELFIIKDIILIIVIILNYTASENIVTISIVSFLMKLVEKGNKK